MSVKVTLLESERKKTFLITSCQSWRWSLLSPIRLVLWGLLSVTAWAWYSIMVNYIISCSAGVRYYWHLQEEIRLKYKINWQEPCVPIQNSFLPPHLPLLHCLPSLHSSLPPLFLSHLIFSPPLQPFASHSPRLPPYYLAFTLPLPPPLPSFALV